MPYLVLLRTWPYLGVGEIPKHYCSCLTAEVGDTALLSSPPADPNTSLITPKGVCMLLQG